jgi:hypothetical protein
MARLIDILQDMNTPTPDMHENANFSQLIGDIEKRIQETPILEDATRKLRSGMEELQPI